MLEAGERRVDIFSKFNFNIILYRKIILTLYFAYWWQILKFIFNRYPFVVCEVKLYLVTDRVQIFHIKFEIALFVSSILVILFLIV